MVISKVYNSSRRRITLLLFLPAPSYSTKIACVYPAVYVRRCARAETSGSGISLIVYACAPENVAAVIIVMLYLQPIVYRTDRDHPGAYNQAHTEGCTAMSNNQSSS